MKQIFTLSFFVFLFSVQAVTAAEHIITVSNFAFAPNDLTVNVGDVITWQHSTGIHNTTSVSVPEGAEAWAAPISSSATSFSYTVEVAGDYSFICTFHGGMDGTFSAQNTVSVANLKSNVSTDLTVRFANNVLYTAYDLGKGGMLDMRLFGLSGQLVTNLKTTSLAAGSYSEQFELNNLPSGVYLVRMQASGEVITRRVFVTTK